MKNLAYSYVRFSTKGQIEGRSLERQYGKAKKYAQEKNLTLNTDLVDPGLSGYHGRNRTKGALGRFYDKVNNGGIPPNTALIIENFDRLSRENPWDALGYFRNLIEAGLKIVILDEDDGVIEYSKPILQKDDNALDYVFSEIKRANKESKRKSELLKDAWSEKRKNIQKKIYTRVCPQWLEWNEEKQAFIKKQEVVKAIRTMYTLYAEGLGTQTIVNRLNNSNGYKPPRSNRNTDGYWAKSSVNRYIYGDIRLLGHLQLYELNEKGKRQPIPGKIVKNYYPPVIDEDLYYIVQKKVNERATNKNNRGRMGNASNVFTGIAKCGWCGSPMHYLNHGTAERPDSKFLECSLHRKQKDACKVSGVRYDKFFNLFFDHYKELEITNLLPNKKQLTNEVKNLKTKQTRIDGELITKDREITNATNAIIKYGLESPVIKLFEQRLPELQREQTELKKEYEVLENRINELSNINTNIEVRHQNVLKILSELESTKNQERAKEIRLRLRDAIQQSIERIEIFGNAPRETQIAYYKNRLENYKKDQKVLIASYNEKLKDLQDPNHQFPEVPFQKYRIYFRGEGIIDEFGDKTQHRFVFPVDKSFL